MSVDMPEWQPEQWLSPEVRADLTSAKTAKLQDFASHFSQSLEVENLRYGYRALSEELRSRNETVYPDSSSQSGLMSNLVAYGYSLRDIEEHPEYYPDPEAAKAYYQRRIQEFRAQLNQ
jgi:uncharacterized membrane-anchored protein YhcB (DUF1043 family)